MITYVELWRAKQAWIDLPVNERSDYMNGLGPAIQQLLDNGVQILSWGSNESSTFNRIDFDYFAVWSFPGVEAAHEFEQMVVGAGWYNYFDQVNAMGATSSPQAVIEAMIKL